MVAALRLSFTATPFAPHSLHKIPGAGAPGGALDASLLAWLAASTPAFQELLALLQQHHARRLEWLAAAGGEARRRVWWPFTQHGSVGPG